MHTKHIIIEMKIIAKISLLCINREADGCWLMQGRVCCEECYNVNIKYGLIMIHSRLSAHLQSVYTHFYQPTIPTHSNQQSMRT